MRSPVAIFVCFALLSAASLVNAGTLADVENAALDHVKNSKNYMDNGGFDEKIVDSSLGEETSLVVIEYATRHVGMLQVIGHFTSYVTVDTETLEVLRCVEEAWQEAVDPSEPGDSDGSGDPDEPGGPGNWTDPDPEPDPGDTDEGYRLKISYTINMTLARIYENNAENDLAEAVNMLDRAQELLGRGEYDAALDLAFRAEDLVNQYLYGTDEPGEEPGEDPGADMPWLYGYIVIFDHEPVDDDWSKLLTSYNATYVGEAGGYTEEANAYWVKVQGITPDDLLGMEGVADVLVLRGGPDSGDAGEEVCEMLAVPAFIGGALLITRRVRRSR